MHRHPAVAGQFYKGSPDALKKQVEAFIDAGAGRKKAIGIVSPHAGLIYSGSVAGAVYSRIELPGTFILIGPNHTGLGAPVSLMAKGNWETPLGTVMVDEALAASIRSRSPLIREDTLAHLREHSLEVQLPFIQYFRSDFKIVPIQMLDARLETCREVGRAVGEALRERSLESDDKRRESEVRTSNSEPGTLQSLLPLIVASSDMSHYEKASVAKDKDFKAIDRILKLDPEGLHRTVKDNSITMCGYGPAVAMLVASRMLGAEKAELVKYANSGDVSGDFDHVVGYAGIVVS
jgi:predicted class III extradiol MEMO1 family dioxygenase